MRFCVAIAVTLLACLAATAARAQVVSYAGVPIGSNGFVPMVNTFTDSFNFMPIAGDGTAGAVCVAMSPDGRYAYAAATANGLVRIDMASGFGTTLITPAAGTITCAAITPDNRKVYAVNAGTNTVTPYDVATGTVEPDIAVGNLPMGLAATPDGQQVYVANSGTNTVSVIDTASNTVVHTITVGFQPTSVAFTPDGAHAYVVNSGANTVSVVDVATATAIPPAISVFDGPRQVAITPAGDKVYVSLAFTHTVAVIDTTSNTVTTTIAVGGLDPSGIDVTPDGTKVYLLDYTAKLVRVIDTATDTLSATTIALPDSPTSAATFMGPMMVTFGSPLSVGTDAGLTAANFGPRFLPFYGGTLKLTGNMSTARTLSLVGDATIDTNAHDLTLTGGITGGIATLTKIGDGTLTIAAATTSATTAKTFVNRGVYMLNGTQVGTMQLNGGTLRGTGTAANVEGWGGAISPGTATTPGTLHLANLTAPANAALNIRINGPGVYDTLAVSGTAQLDQVILNVTMNYAANIGDSFTIVTNSVGTFPGLAEGSSFFFGNNTLLHLTYKGGASGHDVVLSVDGPPTVTHFADQNVIAGTTVGPLPFTVTDDFTDPSALTIRTDSSNPVLVDPANIVIGGTGSARTITATLTPKVSGQTLITLIVGDGNHFVFSTVYITAAPESRTYYLAEGATSDFFNTDLLLANPNALPVALNITFFKADGSTVDQPLTMLPTSRITLPVKVIPGLAAASFSTKVVSPNGDPIAVERTMTWDSTGYGAHGEKASAGPALTWYFAEGSQGYFHTYFLLLNPGATANVAHVTYFPEDGPPVQKDYELPATSRTTIDMAAEAALQNRSFGASITFDQPGMAERAMYFGETPLFSGGTDASGVTAPSTTWYLAEGATGSYFDTFILIANPNDAAANVTTTYLPASGIPVAKTHVIAPHQRLTINIAVEDESLQSAAVGTTVTADVPVVAERSQYWPHGNWYEAHNSAGETAAGTNWALAEGRVGGESHAQTYILLANATTTAANVTATFLRENGTTVVKTFTVPATSRLNIAVTGPGSDVPELADENFGTSLVSTQPIIVERSMYLDAAAVVWAAGTNATGTRMP